MQSVMLLSTLTVGYQLVGVVVHRLSLVISLLIMVIGLHITAGYWFSYHWFIIYAALTSKVMITSQ